MKLNANEIPFLKGEKFNSSLLFTLNTVGAATMTVSRQEYLQKLVQGKSIIHVGCVDHLPLIDEKRKQGNWLHENLTKAASRCVGIDINAEGCSQLRALGFSDIFCFDIIKDPLPSALVGAKFDYLILGEMIEHVDNPVDFLMAVKQKFAGVATTLITTTPNVFRIQNLVNTLRHREAINSDHRYWFSPYTLAKVLSQAGYNEVEIETAWHSPLRGAVSSMLKSFVGSAFPATKDCLIAKARLT